jgi:FkbM family methyltransferase
MALDNVKALVRVGSPLTSLKLLLMQGISSRPGMAPLFRALLRPFVADGRITVRFRCYNRFVTSYIRVAELESDYYSTRELGAEDIYALDFKFRPDVVIDGGGNIGLFTLRTAIGLQAARCPMPRMVICEPVPENLEQVRSHLALNHVHAEIREVCLGDPPRTIAFYCREANQGSFDPGKPYTRAMEIPVIPLREAIGSATVERILIKLDIEGMEVEALQGFVPREHRAVYVVGELHDATRNAPILHELFRAHGWILHTDAITHDLCTFRGCSPAALPLLASMKDIGAASGC